MPSPLSTLCLVLAMCLHIGRAQQCDDGYELFPSYPTSRYKLAPFNLAWVDAVVACQSDGGGSHLVVINSDLEAQVVMELINRVVGANFKVAWVGINDVGTEGTWLTILGGFIKTSGYNRWYRAGPALDTTTNCGYVKRDALYREAPCSYPRPFICEKPN